MTLATWHAQQQSALQTLGYKRLLLRRDLATWARASAQSALFQPAAALVAANPKLAEPVQKTTLQKTTLQKTTPQKTPPTRTIPPIAQPETQPEPKLATAPVLRNEAAQMQLALGFSFFSSTAWAFDWLLPPATGFVGALCHFYHEQESTLWLQALQRCGFTREAADFQTLMNLSLPETLHPSEPPILSPNKILVVVGQSALRYQRKCLTSQAPRVHYLPHPNQACAEAEAKKALWVSLNQLRECL